MAQDLFKYNNGAQFGNELSTNTITLLGSYAVIFQGTIKPFCANYFSGLHWLQQACDINLASDLDSNFIAQDDSLINFVLWQNKVVIQFKSGMTLSLFPKCVAYYN